jgi:hypothetical protein
MQDRGSEPGAGAPSFLIEHKRRLQRRLLCVARAYVSSWAMGQNLSVVGRARAYTPEKHETIIKAIEAGNSKSTAFKLAGLHADTGFDWVAAGKREPEKYPEYVQLAADIEQAEAAFEASRVAIVKTAADTGTWQAAAWWLERRRPEEWSRHDRQRTDNGDKPILQLNQVILVDADAREASRVLLRRVTSSGASLALGPGVGNEASENTPA